MARKATTKLYRTFNRGLITEAGFLTYPENASSDELNTVLNRKGNRTRRLGIDVLSDTSPYDTTHSDTDCVDEYLWKAPANKSELNFLCLRVASNLFIFDTSKPTTTSGLKLLFDFSSYLSPTATLDDLVATNVEMISGKGFLFVVGPFLEPMVVEYDPVADSFLVNKIIIQTRDFDGLPDGLANDEQPSGLSPEHQYNLRNQGWVDPSNSSGVYFNPWNGSTNYRGLEDIP